MILKQILNKFLVIHEVQAAIIAEEDGEIDENIKSGIVIDKKNHDAVISIVMLDSKDTVLHFGNEPLFMIWVEFSDNFIIFVPIAEEFFLIIIAKTTANIGQITDEIKKNYEDIAVQL